MNLKKDIKNRMCYYFDNIVRVGEINFSDILLDEKLYKTKYRNNLIYGISYKAFMGSITLHITFDKIDGFIKIYDGIKYLVLFCHSWYDEICDRIEYLISEKSGVTDSFNHNFATIRNDSHNSLPIEKILTFHNVIILVQSVVNKNKNDYYYNIFLKKSLHKDKSETQYF